MPTKKLTDRQIAVLYSGFVRDYEQYKKANLTSDDIRNRLYSNVYDALRDKSSALHSLNTNDVEKAKVYEVLYAFLDSRESFQSTSPGGNRHFFRTHRPTYRRDVHVHYCHHDDLLYHYLLWDYSFRRRPMGYHGYYGEHHHFREHEHGRGPSEGLDVGCGGCGGGRDDFIKQLVAFLLFVSFAIAAGVALCAMAHTLSEIQNNLERFYYDEGWMLASISLANMAASFTVAGVLTSLLLTAPLVAVLAFAAVSNPVGWAVLGVVLISLIAGAIGYAVSNKALHYGIKKLNSDSLDPDDPYRFRLSRSEERNLQAKGIDPIRVKCAILELRSQIDERNDLSEFSIFSTRSEETKNILDLVRQLRRGELAQVSVHGLMFDCKQSVMADAGDAEEIIPEAFAVVDHTDVPPVPSAPPEIVDKHTKFEP